MKNNKYNDNDNNNYYDNLNKLFLLHFIKFFQKI